MRAGLMQKRLSVLMVIIFGMGAIFIREAKGEEETEIAAENIPNATRIVIAASGPVQYSSFWLNSPYRLVIEFKSKNVISDIEDKLIVNQGVIREITSNYWGGGRKKALKSLIFELSDEVPYKIWQEENAVIIDLKAPLEAGSLAWQVPLERGEIFAGGREVSLESETNERIITRLAAMDNMLLELPGRESRLSFPVPEMEAVEKVEAEIDEPVVTALAKTKILPVVDQSPEPKSGMSGMVFGFAGLTLISGLGFLAWHWRRDKKLKRIESELEEKNRRLKQEEIVRRAIEAASLQREREYARLKSSLESLNKRLIKRGILNEKASSEEKQSARLPEKPEEKRTSSRLPLTKDFNKTVLLRIEAKAQAKKLRCFARNIGSKGLCFETAEEFKEKELINLRLFFYGDHIPAIKLNARIVWRKAEGTSNSYGVNFFSLEEKDKLELNRYIEAAILSPASRAGAEK